MAAFPPAILSAIGRVVASGTYAGANEDFSALKCAVLKAKPDQLAAEVSHAGLVWEFLLGFADKKPMYRSHIIKLVHVLTAAPSWCEVYLASTQLRARAAQLHDDLRTVLPAASHDDVTVALAYPGEIETATTTRLEVQLDALEPPRVILSPVDADVVEEPLTPIDDPSAPLTMARDMDTIPACTTGSPPKEIGRGSVSRLSRFGKDLFSTDLISSKIKGCKQLLGRRGSSRSSASRHSRSASPPAGRPDSQPASVEADAAAGESRTCRKEEHDSEMGGRALAVTKMLSDALVKEHEKKVDETEENAVCKAESSIETLVIDSPKATVARTREAPAVMNIECVTESSIAEARVVKSPVVVSEPFTEIEDQKVMIQERIIEVPKVETRVVEKYVEVPEIRTVEKIVEVPRVIIEERVVEVPKVETRVVEKYVEIPKVIIQERVVEVPKVETRIVEKYVSASQLITREKQSEVTPVMKEDTVPGVPKVEAPLVEKKLVEVPPVVTMEVARPVATSGYVSVPQTGHGAPLTVNRAGAPGWQVRAPRDSLTTPPGQLAFRAPGGLAGGSSLRLPLPVGSQVPGPFAAPPATAGPQLLPTTPGASGSAQTAYRYVPYNPSKRSSNAGAFSRSGVQGHVEVPVCKIVAGDPVEVFSNSHQAWCLGEVAAVDGSMATVAFLLPNGEGATKGVPLGHKILRKRHVENEDAYREGFADGFRKVQELYEKAFN